jgi:hypothetical protein
MAMSHNKTVFISYAREDSESSERLYRDLKNAGLIPWRDKDVIKAGQNWKVAIRKGIKNSRYFIPIFSSKSVEKIGYVQKEFKYAMDIYDQFPESETYIIPARLDNCEIPFEKLEDIQYVDLFPDWNVGVKQIIESIGIEPEGQKKEDGGKEDKMEKEDQWKMGLSDKDWSVLLTSICDKKCIPVIGQGVHRIKGKDGATLVSPFKDIVDKWKEEYTDLLEDLYDLAKVYSLEDSYQLARISQILEIAETDEKFPKDMLSRMLKQGMSYNSLFQTNSSYEILSNLDLPIYLTTNYDTFIEEALSRNPRKKPESDFCKWNDRLISYVKATNMSSVFKDASYIPSEERPLVYHINGHMSIPGSMVLTERDYLEFVAYLNRNEDKDILPAIIRTEISTCSLLFIGYGLEDINFRAIFQGFLSFMSSIDNEFRKPRIAVQMPPNLSNKAQKIQKYLERYTMHMFDVRIYWGTTQDFIEELEKRWNDYKTKNDVRTCSPIKGM